MAAGDESFSAAFDTLMRLAGSIKVPHKFRLLPSVVEHLIGDVRVTGIRNLTPEIEAAINAWIAAGDTDDKGASLALYVTPDGDGYRFVASPFVWEEQGARRNFRLVVLRPDNSRCNITQLKLETLLSRALNIQGYYTVYSHLVPDQDGELKQYVGITKQGWTSRWRQHLNAANNGSPYLFHEALRRRGDRACEFHLVKAVGLSYEEAMDIEEALVSGALGGLPSLYPHGLNAIPGGFAGLAYLGKYGFKNIGPREWEHRSKLLREFASHCVRESKPNPLLAARWRDDEYAASIIFSNPNNFSREQVDEIRYMLSLDHSVEMIAGQFKCDPIRIKRLAEGETYSRV